MDVLTIVTVVAAAGTMLVLAVAMSTVLGWANRAFYVEVDPRIEAIDNALPAANCGNCGYVGCGEYAEAVVTEGAEVHLCPVGGTGTAEDVAAIMGVDVGDAAPQRPIVHCSADYEMRLGRHEYLGEKTCTSANLVAGVQGCIYGCLGLGDCVAACEYDAIHIVNGIAAVDYEKCIGCSACARACPRTIISMVPFKAEQVLAVACSNKDFGKEVKGVCKTGCIGCKSCEKATDGLFAVADNLPVLDYDHYQPDYDFSEALDKCPMASLVWVGKPTEKDLAETAEEELPDRVEVDFKTTVDRTEWRG
jgi:RnfABCDGE-type electron transport complex B subunit